MRRTGGGEGALLVPYRRGYRGDVKGRRDGEVVHARRQRLAVIGVQRCDAWNDKRKDVVVLHSHNNARPSRTTRSRGCHKRLQMAMECVL